MKEITMRHLWSMGDGGWVEIEESGDKYLCSSYLSTKGFTRGSTTSSRTKISEGKYSEIVEKEEAFVASLLENKRQAENRRQRQETCIKEYRKYSPYTVGGDIFTVSERGEILNMYENDIATISESNFPKNKEAAISFVEKAVKRAAYIE